MEELNKTQIILLAIFITLVTSAATGVIVVTLMDQAPQSITQTVNRIVERTVEKVVSPGKVEKTEIKQILKEDDTVVSSIKKTKLSLVRVVREKGSVENMSINPNPVDSSIGQSVIFDVNQEASLSLALLTEGEEGSKIGFFVSNDGLIVTSSSIVGSVNSKYYAILSDGTNAPLSLIKSESSSGVALFKVVISKDKNYFVPISALSSDQVSLGKTVISMGIEGGANVVSMGYVSYVRLGNASSTPVIKTSIKALESWGGRPLIDINGFLIGMYGSNNEVIPYSIIKNLIGASTGAKVGDISTTTYKNTN
ncbi:MAG: serine protease [bacterium]